MPVRPKYYEGIAPRNASIERARLRGEEAAEAGHGDTDSDEEGGVPGMPAGLIGLLQQLQGLGPNAAIQMPNGHVVSPQQLISSLLAGGGLAGVGGDGDDAEAEQEEDEEEEQEDEEEEEEEEEEGGDDGDEEEETSRSAPGTGTARSAAP